MKKILSLFLCLVLLVALLPVSVSAEEEVSFRKETVLAALYEADLSQTRQALDEGLVTSVDLTEFYLERIEAQ